MTDQEGISAGRSFPQWLKTKPYVFGFKINRNIRNTILKMGYVEI